MARERMVTRTITETTVKAMGVNVETAQVDIVEYTLSGEYPDNSTILKVLKKNYENDNYKIVNIENVKTEEKLYGMTEQKFIELAKELPPRA
jgi:hypothetical protein